MSSKRLLCAIVLFCEYHFYVCNQFIYVCMVFRIAQVSRWKFVSMMIVVNAKEPAYIAFIFELKI